MALVDQVPHSSRAWASPAGNASAAARNAAPSAPERKAPPPLYVPRRRNRGKETCSDWTSWPISWERPPNSGTWRLCARGGGRAKPSSPPLVTVWSNPNGSIFPASTASMASSRHVRCGVFGAVRWTAGRFGPGAQSGAPTSRRGSSPTWGRSGRARGCVRHTRAIGTVNGSVRAREGVRRGAIKPEEGPKTPHRAFMQEQNVPVRTTRTSRRIPGAKGREPVRRGAPRGPAGPHPCRTR